MDSTCFNGDYTEFVEKHAGENPDRLRLRYHGDKRDWIPFAINNVAALAKRKKFRRNDGADLTPAVIPYELSAQQATSANIALLHANLAGNARTILDMTFGLGMDALLMSYDQTRTITGIEQNPVLVEAARVNFADRENVNILQGDSVSFLQQYSGKPFDLIFIDPARRGKEGERLYNLHDCQPDLIDLLPYMHGKGLKLMAKLSPMLDVTQTIRDLPGTQEIHIVEENGECKELLALVDLTDCEKPAEEPVIVIDRYVGGAYSRFDFRRAEDRIQPNILGRMPVAGEYLLEPSPATMKAAPFNLLTSRFPISKLQANTHLYIASGPVEDFPGTCQKIVGVYPFSSSNIKNMRTKIDKADIAVRNLKGFTPEILRKRMKLGQGGNHRLYATTINVSGQVQPVLILTEITGN